MSKTSNYIRTICEIGIFAAVGYVLDELQGIISKGLFINGGSIGFAMIAVIIIGYRRGWLPALLTGLIMGLFDVATSAYIIHPAQLFLDYLLPYGFVAVGCLFKYPFDKTTDKKQKLLWLLVGVTVGGLAKFLSHYLAGVLFWANPDNFAWGLQSLNPYLYCFIYNIAFIGPSIVLTAGLVAVMYWRAPRIFVVDYKDEENKSSKEYYPIVFASIVSLGGLFCFVWFLIKYILSFQGYKDADAGAVGYDFDPDSMIISILGLFMVILGVFSFIKIKRGRFSPLFSSSVLQIIVSSSFIYGLARLIRMYVKQKDPTIYWIWFGVSLATIAAVAGLQVYFYIKKKKQINATNQLA